MGEETLRRSASDEPERAACRRGKASSNSWLEQRSALQIRVGTFRYSMQIIGNIRGCS